MSIDEVINYFGNLHRACMALSLTAQNMTTWKMRGYIPYKQQLRLAHITNGDLMPDEEDPCILILQESARKKTQ